MKDSVMSAVPCSTVPDEPAVEAATQFSVAHDDDERSIEVNCDGATRTFSFELGRPEEIRWTEHTLIGNRVRSEPIPGGRVLSYVYGDWKAEEMITSTTRIVARHAALRAAALHTRFLELSEKSKELRGELDARRGRDSAALSRASDLRAKVKQVDRLSTICRRRSLAWNNCRQRLLAEITSDFRINRIPVRVVQAEYYEAVTRDGLTAVELARRLGWQRRDGWADVPRVYRRLGIVDDRHSNGRNHSPHSRKTHVNRDTALAFCRALGTPYPRLGV